MPELTQLVFSCEVLEGFERADVMREVGATLGLDEARIPKLFSGVRVVVKRSVDPVEAQRYAAKFAKLGALLEVETLDAPNAAPTETAEVSTSRVSAPAATIEAPSSEPDSALELGARRGHGSATAASIENDENNFGKSARAGRWPFLLVALTACVVAAVLSAWFVLSARKDKTVEAANAEASAEAAPATPNASPGPPAGAASPFAAGAAAVDVAAAQAAFRGDYAQARAHKAFAVSSGGAWGMKAGVASPQDAVSGALAKCEAMRKPDTGPCKTINLNGQGSRAP